MPTWRLLLPVAVVLLAGCELLSPAPDQPELTLDTPAAISPGNEYHLKGTKLTITNVEFGSGVDFRVRVGDMTQTMHLDEGSNNVFAYAVHFHLKSVDPKASRAVIELNK